MTFILGINSFHGDSSAAIIKDGEVICAIEEERLNRIKHWAGLPLESINWCLTEAGINISDVDSIAVNTLPSSHLIRKTLFTLRKKPKISFVISRLLNKFNMTGIKEQLSKFYKSEKITANINFVEHHRAHMASAYFSSTFNDSAVVSVDGCGDFASCAIGCGVENNLFTKERIFFPHSLGFFYTTITQFLGFPNYGDEYKVMGLAPYGKDTYSSEMRKIVNLLPNGNFKLNLKYFRHVDNNIAEWNGKPKLENNFSKSLEELLGRPRLQTDPIDQVHKDIARSTQIMYEEAFFSLLNRLHRIYPSKKLCIAGGCGYNSVANGKITKKTPFNDVFIHAAAGDSGGAIGAALDVWYKNAQFKRKQICSPYLGTSYSNAEVKNIVKDFAKDFEDKECEIKYFDETEFNENQLIEKIALEISKGKVIGWFVGRMEWGPRALGNRSILGDPRRSDMKDILNLKIKKRESFRPFAPSILKEEVQNWFQFEDSEVINVPYMMKVYPIKEDKRKQIPAVCHVDGSGRLQTVCSSLNSRYHKLIKSFFKITGVPIILNTSFNENEPIVSNPKEAIDCFLRTEMDILVIENCVISR